jgi:hypothetical protein
MEFPPRPASSPVMRKELSPSFAARIFVEPTRPLPCGENKITPFLTNVSFDVAAIC